LPIASRGSSADAGTVRRVGSQAQNVVAAAQRKERARIRSEKGIRWGGRPLATAA
jgi:hypothetical protein